MDKVLVYIIFFLVLIIYVYCILKANFLILTISQEIAIKQHWSGRIGIKELKKAYYVTNEKLIKKAIKKAILLSKISIISVYVGILFILIIMVIKI